MTEDTFIYKHSKTWTELEKILDILHKNRYENASFDTIQNFDRLYKTAASHLSYAQTYFPDSQVCMYLNSIVSRAHNYYYTTKKQSFKNIIKFYTKDIPYTFIKNWKFFAVSFLIFIIASFFSFVYTQHNVKNAYVFLPDNMVENISINDNGTVEWNNPIMSGVIMSNNIFVALRSFAYGISMGIGTIYILIQNGYILGCVTSLALKQSNSIIYWSLILPHGIIELCAIFISGAAGLKIGYSLIRPGKYRRKDALIIAGKEALKLIGAVVPMLIIAGIIEGFLTPSSLSPKAKLIFAAFTGIATAAYFFTGIKPQNKTKSSSAF